MPIHPGPRPSTTPWVPHIQTTQNAPPAATAALAARVFVLPDVEQRPGAVADSRERAIWPQDHLAPGPPDAILGKREIGHFHPWDQSLHIALPPEWVEEAVGGRRCTRSRRRGIRRGTW